MRRASPYLSMFVAALFATVGPAPAGGWSDLGGKIKDSPSIVVLGPAAERSVFIAARGADNSFVWNERQAGGTWSGWKSAGGVISSSPSCVTSEAGLIKCFARSKDGFLLMRSYSGGRWSDWSSPYEWYFRLSGPPVATYTSPFHGTVLAAGIPAIHGTQDSVHRVQMLQTRGTRPERWNGWISTWSWAPISGNTLFDCDTIPIRPYDPRDLTWVGRVAVMKLGSCQACLFRDPSDGSLSYTYRTFGRRYDGTDLNIFAYVDLKRAPATSFAPDVLLEKSARDELQITVTLTATDGTVRRGFVLVADNKADDRRPGGTPWTSLGGNLISAPACSGAFCVGQGPNGGVQLLELSTK